MIPNLHIMLIKDITNVFLYTDITASAALTFPTYTLNPNYV